jgi:Site-specific recombinase XerD
MSVYKTSKSRFYQYDFVIQGRRYHGSTGQTTRRAAEAYEDRQRRAAAEGKLGEAAQLTLDEACGKWWVEVGQYRGESDRDREFKRMQRLVQLFPKTIRICEITTAHVAEAVQRRRGITFKRGKDRRLPDGRLEKAREYAVSNATVNRDVIQPLKKVLRRARRVWGAKGLEEIAWDEVTLDQGRPAIRWYSQEEIAAWTAQNGPTAALALRLLLRYGLRFGELFFSIHAFEPEGPRLGWFKGRKKDVWHTVPLLPDDAAEIAARVGRAKAAGLDTIWFVEEVEEREDGERKVRLVPLTYYGLHQRLRTAAKRAGIRPGRIIHGARHHAGTTIQRAYKNAKVTQRLLGHLDPRSTDVYVHAMEDEVLAALQAAEQSRNTPGAGRKDRKKRSAG